MITTWVANELVFASGPDFGWLRPDTRPAWEAINDWCRKHGIDPRDVPLSCTITRLVEERQICVPLIERDDRGRARLDERGDRFVIKTVLVQLEAPPLPFPAEVLA